MLAMISARTFDDKMAVKIIEARLLSLRTEKKRQHILGSLRR